MMLTHTKLLEMIHYDPETGVFTWLVNRRGPARKGMRVGSVHGEYFETKVDGRRCLLHTLAFFYMTSEWPSKNIDHINHNGQDNRWCNLREADHSQNGQNQRLSIRNRSGFKGVFRLPSGMYKATIKYGGKSRHLGIFASKAKAAEIYADTAREHFGEFAHVARRA